MLIGVTQRLAGQFDPRVREELAIRAPHADAYDRAVYAPGAQHPREGNRANETLGAEGAIPGGAHHGEREAASFGHACRVGVEGPGRRRRQRSNRP